jgi:site-specific DNA-cytosine methylase
MRLLELFCGTKSISRTIGNKFTEVINLDFNPKYSPTICCNILTWDYTIYPPGHFDVIWSSPDCTQYSKAKTRGERNLTLANSVVMKTIEIINYFQPRLWFMENPQTGLLKAQPFMSSLPYYDVDYCQYGYSYRKRTRIWTNKQGFEGKLCNKETCTQVKDGRHLNSCGNGYKKYSDRIVSKEEKYSLPPELIHALFYE